ncbi:MAG: Hsp33 family molecular chaperone [Rhizobiales bacterium]|nr:Hsp33 family molecular chaperone [Hyphomicrobiales bacterium]
MTAAADGAATHRPQGPADDDLVLPFRAIASGVNGRLVRLGPLVDAILARHDYPEPVARLMGEALALASLLGTALKFGSRFTLQTQTDGPVGFLVVDFQAPGQLRGYASFDRAAVERLAQAIPAEDREQLDGALLGRGRLAMTIDPGPGLNQYQGLVAVEGGGLAAIADTYFRQSEQLPTFIRLAVSRILLPAAAGWRWRVGGLMVQHMPTIGGQDDRPEEAPPGEAGDDDVEPGMRGDRDENWSRTRLLAETVEDHELTDPMLSPQELLYRLFHEEGVRVFESRPLADHCPCTRDRIEVLLASFPAEQLSDMVNEDGRIEVTCQFCSRSYLFDPAP